MTPSIRLATAADVPAMVRLSDRKRTEYQSYQPVFWRRAPDANERQAPFFEHLLTRENVIALVHQSGGATDGFLVATMVNSPPVYAPGGLTCTIDDYCVADSAAWETVGGNLLAEAVRRARERGAIQIVVVCGHLDEPKRVLLRQSGLSIASEWWTRPI